SRSDEAMPTRTPARVAAATSTWEAWLPVCAMSSSDGRAAQERASGRRQPREERRVEARALAQRDQHGIVLKLLQGSDFFCEDVDRNPAAQARDGRISIENAVVIVEDRDLLHEQADCLTSRSGESPSHRAARARGWADR